jgi:hypothetical protein
VIASRFTLYWYEAIKNLTEFRFHFQVYYYYYGRNGDLLFLLCVAVFISQKPQLRGSGIKGQPPCLVGWSAAATILLLLVVRETCKHAKRFNAAFLLSVCCVRTAKWKYTKSIRRGRKKWVEKHTHTQHAGIISSWSTFRMRLAIRAAVKHTHRHQRVLLSRLEYISRVHVEQ